MDTVRQPNRLRRWRRRVVTLLVFCSTAVLCACGGSDGERLPVHPARGTVLYKGKPLADALVVLRPVNASAKQGGPPQSIGRTNSEGKFVLHTYVGDDGAPEGSYLVGISVSQAFSENRDLFENAKKKQVSRPAPDPLGTRYSDPATSGLKAEIKPGENEIPPFELS